MSVNVNAIARGSHARRRRDTSGWLPLLTLPVLAVIYRQLFAGWVFMWLLAGAIWAGCKWLTWRSTAPGTSWIRSVMYLFAWPGLDAANFLTKTTHRPVAVSEWIRSLACAVTGAVLFAFAAGSSHDSKSLVVAWAGMAGVALFLHFGTFHLLALAYRSAGIDASPLMRRPARATSLADFWGSRWNTSFSKLANDRVFRPLARPIGIAWATLAVFFVSGAIHDLVISLPARGGFGLPTAYFALQGAFVLFERSRTGRDLGLGRGWRGRVFTLSVILLPLPLLFHAEFARNVILPMLEAIGGTWRTP